MINIKSASEINLMTKAGEMAYKTHKYIEAHIKPGITTDELNDLAEKYIEKLGAKPAFKDYKGYPKAICISVNEEVVHGIPGKYELKNGDIVSIDIGINYEGYHSDSAWTYPVGHISDEKQHLLEHTKKALYEGINKVAPGNRIGDISSAIEEYAKKHKLSVIKELVGHGIGRELHEEPDIPNYGKPNTGPIMKSGMVIAIEPMLNSGKRNICLKADKWTIMTIDQKPSAHFEHTVLITENGYKILTGE
jgi:methionyl aminopeptidase